MFLSGIKKLSDEGLQAAVLMKHAGRETRRLQALAMAWQLKEAEYYGRLMKEVCVAKHKHYEEHHEATSEGMVIHLKADESADDNMDGTVALDHELYNEYIVSIDTMGDQLDQLEVEVKGRLSTSPCNSQQAGSSFNHYAGGSAGLKNDIDGDI